MGNGRGSNIPFVRRPREGAERAVTLAESKYCPASAMLRRSGAKLHVKTVLAKPPVRAIERLGQDSRGCPHRRLMAALCTTSERAGWMCTVSVIFPTLPSPDFIATSTSWMSVEASGPMM